MPSPCNPVILVVVIKQRLTMNIKAINLSRHLFHFAITEKDILISSTCWEGKGTECLAAVILNVSAP